MRPPFVWAAPFQRRLYQIDGKARQARDLADRLFHPTLLAAILASVAQGRAEQAMEVDTRVSALQTEVTDADEKLKRLYRMVDEDITEIDDILKERPASLKLTRDCSKAVLDRIRTHVVIPFP